MSSGTARSGSDRSETPKVRVLIVNFDGGDMTLACLAAVRELDWPADALEVMVVDNASIDGIAPRIREEMPWVRLVENPRNAGFAGGCNVGLRDLDGVDFVALLNNDAIPDRDWLRPLVDAFASDPRLGAANSKIVFAPSFVDVTFETPTFAPPGWGAPLGVMVSGVEVDGNDVLQYAHFADGFHSHQTRGASTTGCWSSARATLRVPLEPGVPMPERVRIELRGEQSKRIVVHSGSESDELMVGSEPAWFDVRLGGPAFDVINNVGSRLVEGGYGGDRGFLEPDVGQYDEPAEVFAWCGAAVLLSTRYLREVGVFDERYFVYYEDTDLSWRGRLAGWRYVYVPSSVVRHVHAATSSEGSALYTHYVERNRLLTLARNAPRPMLAGALWGFSRDTLAVFKHDVVERVLARRGPSLSQIVRRGRAFGAFVKLMPDTIATRGRGRAARRTRLEVAGRWTVPR